MDELRTALELATDEELHAFADLLFRPKFNPLDYLSRQDALAVQSLSRADQVAAIEARFRFLAADGVAVLRRQDGQLSYRQALTQVCRYLKLPYPADLSTADLEAEVFLHLLEQSWQKLPAAQQQQLQHQVRQSIHDQPQFGHLPLELQRDPLSLILKGSSALAVSSVLRPWLLNHIAHQFALQFATYQVARHSLARGGAALAARQIQQRAAVHMASRGMALNAARYGAVRGVFAFLGPALWTWFLADLGWRAIATNYGRVVPVVFALAQIRLTRASALASQG